MLKKRDGKESVSLTYSKRQKYLSFAKLVEKVSNSVWGQLIHPSQRDGFLDSVIDKFPPICYNVITVGK